MKLSWAYRYSMSNVDLSNVSRYVFIPYWPGVWQHMGPFSAEQTRHEIFPLLNAACLKYGVIGGGT